MRPRQATAAHAPSCPAAMQRAAAASSPGKCRSMHARGAGLMSSVMALSPDHTPALVCR